MAANSNSSDLSILKVDLTDLAKQICLKDMELFKAITKEEINSFYWTKPSKKNKCPHLLSSHKQFNKINFWAQKEILDHANTPKGVKVLSKFIQLSKCLLDKHNFQSAYSVKAALDSTPIHRLEPLWSDIPSKYKKMWDSTRSVFSLENNYENLRNATNSCKPPLIPFLGVFLCDLTGLDAAHPKVDGVETEIRRTSMAKIYKLIERYQANVYEFKTHRGLQDYIQSMEYIDEFENYMVDAYFNISRELDSSCCLSGSISSRSSNVDLKSEHSSNSIQLKNTEMKNRNSYRVISEEERKQQTVIVPDSPTLTDDRHCKHNGKKLKNIIDDSELPSTNDDDSNQFRKPLHHTLSIQSQSSTCSNKFINSPALNHQISSDRKSDIETKSYLQYNDPDMLTISRNHKPTLVGLVKRKIKSKSAVSMSSAQRVLAKLFVDPLDCYIIFYTSKLSKPKSVEDFRDEYNAQISVMDVNLRFEHLINKPKLFIDLPHEIYEIKSVEDGHANWPPLDKWWSVISDSINQVKTSKAKVFQPNLDLINLNDDFTRL